jgi:hypothetical membrane protein
MNGRKTLTARSLLSLSGILGPCLMGLGMLISALAYTGHEGEAYSLLNHFVSELGELGVSELATLFNGGLLIGGIMAAVFMVYLASQFQNWIRYPLGVVSMVAALCGALVGIYPMNAMETHLQVALAFFNLGLLISFLYSAAILFSRRHPFPRWLAIPGLLNTGSFFLFLNFPSEFDAASADLEAYMREFVQNRPNLSPLALTEWVVVLGILAWILILAIYLFRNRVDDLPSRPGSGKGRN